MLLTRRPRALYAAFDRFPTRKGASTHIARFAPALFEEYGGGLLYVVCLLYTSDAADERSSVDLGGRRIIKKKSKQHRGIQ